MKAHLYKQNSNKRRGWKTFLTNALLLVGIVTVCFLIVGVPTGKQSKKYSIPAKNVTGYIKNVLMLPDYTVYHLTDDQGVLMTTAKVVKDNRSGGGYFAIYNDIHTVFLATSDELGKWTEIKILSLVGTNPTIEQSPDGGYIVGFEKWGDQKDGGYSQIHFEYYASANDLVSDGPIKTVDLRRSLSPCNEGTPNIYNITFSSDINHSRIEIGFHYHIPDGTGICLSSEADREGRGVLTNFSKWSAKPDKALNNLCNKYKLYTCGGRDSFVFQGKQYTLVEGWMIQDDWSTWRILLFDGEKLNPLPLTARDGTKSFGNPRISLLQLPDGSIGLVIILFDFESGGPLLYYKSIT